MSALNRYIGLAGETETCLHYERKAGLHRSRGGTLPCQRLSLGSHPNPGGRAIAVHPRECGTLLVRTQDGIHRSRGAIDTWSRLSAQRPRHGMGFIRAYGGVRPQFATPKLVALARGRNHRPAPGCMENRAIATTDLGHRDLALE